MKDKMVAYTHHGKAFQIGHIIADEDGVYSIEWDVKNPAFMPSHWNLTHREFNLYVRTGHIEIMDNHITEGGQHEVPKM